MLIEHFEHFEHLNDLLVCLSKIYNDVVFIILIKY